MEKKELGRDLGEGEKVESILGEVNGVKHYADGRYNCDKGDIGYAGNIYLFANLLSSRFNQLKAKLFNLAETSATNETQLKAMKGLIKDFCNEQYKCSISDMSYQLRQMGFIIEEYRIDEFHQGLLSKDNN
jgi:hypothetical protein